MMRFMFSLIFVLFAFNKANAQSDLVTDKIHHITKDVEAIDRKREHGRSIVIRPYDSVQQSYTMEGIHAYGYFSHKELIKVYLRVMDPSLWNWTISYYIKDDSLIYVFVDGFVAAILGGPNWYERAYSCKYWCNGSQVLATELMTVNKYLPDVSTYTWDQLLELYQLYASELKVTYLAMKDG